MAKLNYNPTLISSAIDLLNQGTKELSTMTSEMDSAISVIKSARGIEYVNTSNLSNSSQLIFQGIDTINKLIKEINDKAKLIEQYNKDVESANPIYRLLNTYSLSVAKKLEGFGTAGEQITDGFISAIGMVVGLFSSGAKEKIGDYIKKDHVGDFFQERYKVFKSFL